MAQAELEMGNRSRCRELCTQALKISPDFLPSYLQVASILGRWMSLKEVSEYLASAKGVRPALAAMADGWYRDLRGDARGAADAFGRIVNDNNAPAELRSYARLLRAQDLGRLGEVDQAVADLDLLATKDEWRRRALFAKAALLMGAGRAKEARPDPQLPGRPGRKAA